MQTNKKTIGLIGGGQLAQMLAIRGRQMGLKIYVLSPKKDDPAAQFASEWICGDPYNLQDLKKLFIKADYVTFENEFIPATLIQKATLRPQHCYPSLEHLAILQDRWPQKELLWDYQIPTAPFVKINSKDDLESAFDVFDGDMVIKERHGGYDGLSTYIIKSRADLGRFKRAHPNQETQYIAEKFIHFKSEKSLVMARNKKKDFFIYPLMHTLQKNHQCYRVWGPAKHPALPQLTEKIKNLLNEINFIGLISFELFDLGKELLINEIAPRVHNSGHITQDAFSIDQFELHLRSILGIDFPNDVQSTACFLMQNILGKSYRKPLIANGLNGRLHWYGKDMNRPKRKLGHLNYTGSRIAKLIELAESDLRKIKT